jgi:hypothetical protein
MIDHLHTYRQIHTALRSAHSYVTSEAADHEAVNFLLQAKSDYEKSLALTTGLSSKMFENISDD